VSDPLITDPGSWVIREKATGRAVLEVFDRATVDRVNIEKYEAVPIAQHLRELNRRLQAERVRGSPSSA
jgi:hypothetical protein